MTYSDVTIMNLKCLKCGNHIGGLFPAMAGLPHYCNLCQAVMNGQAAKAKQQQVINDLEKWDVGRLEIPDAKKEPGYEYKPVPLEANRQVGKKLVGPAVLMEIFGHQLQIGKEKGYSDGSWKAYLTNGEDLEPSISRHTIGVQEGIDDGWYTEYHPKTGEPLPTKANHAYARFWNAAVDAMRVYYREKEKNK